MTLKRLAVCFCLILMLAPSGCKSGGAKKQGPGDQKASQTESADGTKAGAQKKDGAGEETEPVEISKSTPDEPAPPVEAKPLETPVAVTALAPVSLYSSVLFLAQKEGYFKAYNVDAQVKGGDGSAASGFDAVEQGAADFAVVRVDASFFKRLNGSKVKIVAGAGDLAPGSAYLAFLVRKPLAESKDYAGLPSLAGKKLAVSSKGSQDHIVAARLMDKIREKTILVEMPYEKMNAALADGSVDAALQVEPLASKAVAAGTAVVGKGADWIYSSQNRAVVIASEKALSEKSLEAAKRWMTAYVHGARDYNAALKGGEAARKSLYESLKGKINGLDADGMASAAGSLNVNLWARPDLGTLQSDLDWYAENGLGGDSYEVAGYFDRTLVDFAAETLGVPGAE